MFLVIEYEDGTGEAVKATLEGGIVSQGRLMIPGLLIQNPKDCYFKSDYFEAAINEGDERSGEIKPDETEIDSQGCPLFKAFTWKIVGNERVDCLEKMATWVSVIGASFDPSIAGENYLHEGLSPTFSVDLVRKYDLDRQCWLRFIDDPSEEAVSILARGNYRSSDASSPKP